MFIILLPTMLPIPISPFLLKQEIKTVINSGNDVPIAKTVIPITASDKPTSVKINRACDKNTLPPKNIPINDNAK